MQREALGELGPSRRRALLDRDAGIDEVASDVSETIDAVRERGDQAVRSFTERFDDVSVGNLDATGELDRATDSVDPDVLEAIREAADHIRTFHERQVPQDWVDDSQDRQLGRQFRAIDRVGAYVPGGTAAYPSSALMTVIPAKVAGVEQVAVATPPGNPINPVTLAALSVAGVDEVYRVGGAQAIAALAYGTETIPAVRKIVGPGNRWVSAAKQQVQTDVPIDFVAGPSEVIIIADDTGIPEYIAADLIAQAEHGPRSSCVLVTDSETVASQTAAAVQEQLTEIERESVAREALTHDGSGLFYARSMSEAIGFAEEYAGEHLVIQAEDDESILDRIDSAGSVFLGPHTPVAAGDYASGTNHVLPTNGLAKVTGGLAVDDFMRTRSIQRLSREGLADLSATIQRLAEAEGLSAHARSVACRLTDLDPEEPGRHS